MNLPETDSIRELAAFWDDHDVTQFEDQLVEVVDPVFVRPSDGDVTVPLTSDERNAVRSVAAARGVEEAALIRTWVQEKLHR